MSSNLFVFVSFGIIQASHSRILAALDRAVRREAMTDKLASVKKISVEVYTCLACQVIDERKPSLFCRTSGHVVSKSRVSKRFFRCKVCNTYDAALGLKVGCFFFLSIFSFHLYFHYVVNF